ncbi:MAG: toxin-antitoxin system YwqK family antitoxin, partial [Planctomycetota bacterium]
MMRSNVVAWMACVLASCAQVSEVRRADGVLVASGALQHGLQRGTWTHYHPDGSKQAEGPCKDDLQQGAWTWWRPDGSV